MIEESLRYGLWVLMTPVVMVLSAICAALVLVTCAVSVLIGFPIALFRRRT